MTIAQPGRTPGGSSVTNARNIGNPSPDALDDNQCRAILAHLNKHLGPSTGTFVEIMSEYVRLDLVVFPANAQRRFAVVCTLGCSARAMAVPESMRDFALQEFLVCVPPGWPLPGTSAMDDEHWWPFRLLKEIARLPHSARTFAAPATTIPNGDPAAPYAPGSLLCAAMVWTPIGLPEALATCTTPPSTVRISQIVALTQVECDFKLNIGHGELITLLGEYAPDFAVIDPARACAATKFVARIKGEDGLNDSYATRPGGLPLSEKCLREMAPELFGSDVLPHPFNKFYGKKSCTALIREMTDHLSEG
ncbi:MAG TPA: suppressor of fused domain protein, partial [Planctomycetota bacterium]|nr:suppressor of fused domain protein [Planctomycetota bacterium]